MFLIQLLLPLYDNQKNPFPREHFEGVRRTLTETFGGVTAYQRSPAVGLWKENEAVLSRDDVVMIEVMADKLDTSWWASYREKLESEFRQEELVLRAIAVQKL
jgi:hypothetical protein